MAQSRTRIALLGGLLLALIGPQPLHAGGFTIIELGAKKTGMMTSIAVPDDLSAVFHNPAGLADLRGTRFHVSFGMSFVQASARLKAWPGGEGRYGSEDFIDTPVTEEGFFEGTYHPTRYFGVMPMLGLSTDFGFEKGPVVALSVYVPDFIGAFMPEDAPSRYIVTEAYFVVGLASLTAACHLPEPIDWISLGASLGVMYVRMEGKRWLNVPLYGDVTADYTLHLLGEDYRPFWNLGLTARPLKSLALGLVLLGGTNVALDGNLDIALPPGVEEEDPVLLAVTEGRGLLGRYDQTTRMKVPQGLGVGINWTVIDELDLAFDFRWWFYDAFKEQSMDHNIDQTVLGEPAVEDPMITPKDYEPSWTVSAGTLVRPLPDSLPLELMAGFTYDKSPSPSRTKSLESPTTNLAGLSFGARYLFAERWRVALTYYHYWYLKDEVNDSILDPPQNSIFSGSVNTVSLQLEVLL
ncbi:MAG: outer membrane protein transport protein [Deltaproteobacteria bacterium]|nr:outer membrane protein transport protein [Deltaproteobacteria bacterium]